MILSPLQRKLLVQDTRVGCPEAMDFVGREEAERAETVLDGDAYEFVVVGIDYG